MSNIRHNYSNFCVLHYINAKTLPKIEKLNEIVSNPQAFAEMIENEAYFTLNNEKALTRQFYGIKSVRFRLIHKLAGRHKCNLW